MNHPMLLSQRTETNTTTDAGLQPWMGRPQERFLSTRIMHLLKFPFFECLKMLLYGKLPETAPGFVSFYLSWSAGHAATVVLPVPEQG
jgi:hypothetical protein